MSVTQQIPALEVQTERWGPPVSEATREGSRVVWAIGRRKDGPRWRISAQVRFSVFFLFFSFPFYFLEFQTQDKFQNSNSMHN